MVEKEAGEEEEDVKNRRNKQVRNSITGGMDPRGASQT